MAKNPQHPDQKRPTSHIPDEKRPAPAPDAPAPAPDTRPAPAAPDVPAYDTAAFVALVRHQGAVHWRDLPWRQTRDPYAIWISEVMLQQTQVSRVDGRWQRWLTSFPTVEALATAPQATVLAEWQGMGYNRRALALKAAATQIMELHAGTVPQDTAALTALPGIGPATAAGIRAFAFDLPALYLETNVRCVLLHELFPDAQAVPDRVLLPILQDVLPAQDIRGWYYALLDYGAFLKKTVPNPTRRSKSYVRQSRFEGSWRQKRAALLRMLLEATQAGLPGMTAQELHTQLNRLELAAGREFLATETVQALMQELEAEGFCVLTDNFWSCA